ncbi:MAG: RNA ligase family protein [Bryobacterales bacterium]|nr:RNA ligase family protein [Bryobacterales bacterium]
MARILHKFPRTPHLAWLGPGLPRDDKVLSPEERALFLEGGLVIEEKADGANIGIGFDDTAEPVVWNRGTVLCAGAHPQFQAFWPWLAQRRNALWEAMQGNLILFGEWCFAVHSVHYDRLPDYFLAIDVYDRQAGRFWISRRRDDWTARVGVAAVPVLARGRFGLDDLKRLLNSTASRLGSEPIEGIYLRREEEPWLLKRAKLVRPEFTQSIEKHWTGRQMEKNTVLPSPC